MYRASAASYDLETPMLRVETQMCEQAHCEFATTYTRTFATQKRSQHIKKSANKSIEETGQEASQYVHSMCFGNVIYVTRIIFIFQIKHSIQGTSFVVKIVVFKKSQVASHK